MAAPTFVIAVDSGTGVEATPQTVTIPAHSSGDIGVVVMGTTDGTTTPATAINTPAGWTAGPDIEAGDASAVRLSCFLKDLDGAENSVDFTLSGTPVFGFAAVCVVFSGAEAASSAIDVSNTTVQDGGVDIDAPSVTTTVINTAIVYGFVWDGTGTSEADIDSDGGFSGTLRGYEEISGSGQPHNGLAVAASTKTQASAGATGTCTFSTLASDDAGCTFTIAIKSASSMVPILHSYRQRREK